MKKRIARLDSQPLFAASITVEFTVPETMAGIDVENIKASLTSSLGYSHF